MPIHNQPVADLSHLPYAQIEAHADGNVTVLVDGEPVARLAATRVSTASDPESVAKLTVELMIDGEDGAPVRGVAAKTWAPKTKAS